MNKPITIREASESDFPSIFSMILEFAKFQKSADRVKVSLEDMLEARSWFGCFVALSPENEIIGYATCFPAYYTWSGKAMNLDDLYVQEAWRGQGAGTLLIQKVISHARDSGCRKVKWQVSHWNEPARRFYESLGAILDHTEMNCDLSL